MKRFVLLLLIACLCTYFAEAQKVIVRDYWMKRSFSIDSIVKASSEKVIAKIGKENFKNWTDSISVRWINTNPCAGVKVPCDPPPPMISDRNRHEINYYFSVPGYGKYVKANFAYQNLKGKMEIEDRWLFPPAKELFKYHFIKKDSAIRVVIKYLYLKDTAEVTYKFQPMQYAGLLAWEFGVYPDYVIMDAMTGKVLHYSGPRREKVKKDSIDKAKPKETIAPPPEQKCNYTTYAPVTGKNKRHYLNKCQAEKAGVKVMKEGYEKKYYKESDVFTWPIEQVCDPLPMPGDTVRPESLKDGTLIYTRKGKKFRGTQNLCRCLPGETKIATPRGEKRISELATGDTVWTADKTGKRVAAPLVAVNKVNPGDDHQMVCIELADGRSLKATPEHPSADENRSIDQFNIGHVMDGSSVVKKYYMPYGEPHTFDILPAGETGTYWAKGVLIGSTLSAWYKLSAKK